jgi:tetratricopeptide (TPR) repeat protein
VALDNRRALAASEAGLKRAPNNVDLLGNAAMAEQALGRWDASLQHLAKAGALDPRSGNTARRTGATLLWLRRYPEAQAAMDRGLALAPTNLQIIELKAMVALAQGDLTGARAVMRRALTTVEPAALIAFFGYYWDLYWVLDDAQQQQLLSVTPSAFDNDRATWAIIRAETYQLCGDPAQDRVYADSARLAYEEQLRAAPEDGQRHVFRGLALAYSAGISAWNSGSMVGSIVLACIVAPECGKRNESTSPRRTPLCRTFVYAYNGRSMSLWRHPPWDVRNGPRRTRGPCSSGYMR